MTTKRMGLLRSSTISLDVSKRWSSPLSRAIGMAAVRPLKIGRVGDGRSGESENSALSPRGDRSGGVGTWEVGLGWFREDGFVELAVIGRRRKLLDKNPEERPQPCVVVSPTHLGNLHTHQPLSHWHRDLRPSHLAIPLAEVFRSIAIQTVVLRRTPNLLRIRLGQGNTADSLQRFVWRIGHVFGFFPTLCQWSAYSGFLPYHK